ncbi:MAG: NAD(P)/FAD-dependent oxidoreductase [Acidobacteriia bacterium]|nr:NAD(P)/FAD-dependent oxidoreductase [Terriglobia bacterium]
MPDIAVVGAGLTGLVAAYRLATAGWKVTVFERYPEAGGLVACFDAGGERLECFYHHLFTTDTDYLALADEFGLGQTIDWLPSRMGIFSRDRLWDFGTPVSLLKFEPLPWVDKVRFGWSTLVLNRTADYHKFETVTAHDWIVAHAGRKVYDTVWGPLLHQKFAEKAEDVAMVWLWGKVYLRGRSRSTTGMGERLGYMRGSFGRLVVALIGRLRDAGARLEFANPVKRISRTADGLEVQSRTGTERFARALFTAAPSELARVAGEQLPDEYRANLIGLPATAALCVVLELSRSLTPYYWLNIADPDFPFGGLIEHTNYIPRERYGGRYLLYISKYMFRDHALWSAREDEVWHVFRPYLSRINHEFDDSWVLARHHFKAAYAQPVIPCNYPAVIPRFETPVRGLYHACMAQIYPEDRGQNYAVRSGNQAAQALVAAAADGL